MAADRGTVQLGVFLAFCTFVTVVVGKDLLGCGGFVQSSAKIDFARIEVKILSKSTGSVKFKTTCAPNSGYYLVPLYSKGEYVVKLEAPSGWNFERSEVEVVVNGEDDPCTLQEDINFQFTGFTVFGKLVGKGKTALEGPAGVTVQVHQVDTNSSFSTVSTAGGEYTFNNLLPGEYRLEPSHPTWTLQEGPFKFTVKSDAIALPLAIEVYGYDVNGVVTDGSSPVEGALVLLNQVDGERFYCVRSYEERQLSYREVVHNAVCQIRSNSEGKFSFLSVAPANYELRVQFAKGDVHFGVKPSRLDISIKQGTVNVPEPFKVEGFQVKGFVRTTSKGDALAGAKVFVDGGYTAESGSDGMYSLNNMSAGRYQMKVEAEGFEFEPLELVVTLSSPSVPDIVPSKFATCGDVQVDQKFEKSSWLIRAVDSKKKETAVLSTRTDAKREFCFLLQPGKYSLQIEVPESESKQGLLFQPASREVTVEHSPQKVVFAQYKTSVSGKVLCIGDCPASLPVVLVRESTSASQQPAKMEQKGNQLKFEFQSVYPGAYKARVSVPDWCWSASEVEVKVEPGKATSDIQLVQSGFEFSVSSTHDVKLEYSHSKVAHFKGSFDVKKGDNKFCLEKEGSYSLLVAKDSCHKFQQDSFKYSVASPQPLSLKATHHETVFGVEVPSDLFEKDVSLRIKSQFYSEIEPEVLVQYRSVANGTAKDRDSKILSFIHMARTSDRLEIVPQSSSLLFNPLKGFHDVSNICPQKGPSFTGSTGTIVKGEVTPPLKGVTIIIETEGYDPVVVESNEKGHYTAGPFVSGAELKIEASKEGYSFERLNEPPYSFAASVLNFISVTIMDEDRNPLPGVLVSLSSTNFRSNSLTSEEGVIFFRKLSTGEYHIRPFFREYNFHPPSQDILVEGGSNIDAPFIGRRTAFSCAGVVQTLVGEGIAGATVKLTTVAHDDDCMDLSESVATEESGSFRISGLVPSCEYLLMVHFNQNQSLEAVPPQMKITGTAKDISDLLFVAMPTVDKMEVSGFVSTEQEFLTTMKVSLYEALGANHPVQSVALDTVGFFYLPGITYKENVSYTLSLESHLSRSKYTYSLPAFDFVSFRGSKHFRLEFKTQEIVATKKSSFILQIIITIFLAAAFLLLGLAKVFGWTYSSFTSRLSQLSAYSHDDKNKKKHK